MLFDFRNIIVLVSLAFTISLYLVLFRHGRNTLGGRAYSIVILTIACWIFPMFLYRSNVFGLQILWVRLLYVMASLTSTSFIFFSYVFPDEKKVPTWMQIVLFLENLIIILICFHPTYLIQGVKNVFDSEPIILWGPYYIVYSLHISLLFFCAFIILFLKWLKSRADTRAQVAYILVSYSFSSFFAMLTNLVFPWFGYFELNWLGQFFSTIVAIITTYAIIKHNLLDIKLFATEGFLIIINLLLFIQFLVSIDTGRYLINGIVLASVLVVSLLLIQSVQKEIKRREEVTVLAQSLEKANIKLQELDRQKTDFLSIAAHQLRTPLSIINGYIELLHDDAYGKMTEEAKEVFKNIDESNGHLVKLVDSFLDITRLEQGRTKYDFSEHDVCKIIDGVVNELRVRADQKEVKLNWARCVENTKLFFDEEKIRHVIYNFIDNAIKYTDQGFVLVDIYLDNGGVVFKVKDSGLGFDKIDEANFFQKFYRGNNVKGINVNGTGLGLYVCAKFIEAHHGRVWAHSEGLGKGSEFGFWIPAHQS